MHNFVQVPKQVKKVPILRIYFLDSGQGGLWEGGKAVAILSDLAKWVSSHPSTVNSQCLKNADLRPSRVSNLKTSSVGEAETVALPEKLQSGEPL